MPITLRDIAAHAGVSLPTVSQILSPTSRRAGLFAPSTRARVESAALELGYRPNTAARSIATGHFGAVTLLLSHHANRSVLPPALLAGVDEALAQSDLHLMVARLPDQKLTDAGEAPKLLRQLASDGLLINYNAHIPREMIDLIERHRLPSVWINSKQAHACVHPADEEAGRALTRLLVEAGHERIAFIDYTYGPAPDDPHYSNTDRRDGYRHAMQEAGLAPRLICGEGNIPLADRIAFTRRWMESPDCPTAVVCYTHHESSPILTTTDRMGLTIPRDLSIVTIHDEPVQHYDVLIPTAVLPEREIGGQAVAMLNSQIAGESPTGEPVAVPLALVHTAHVAPPAHGPSA